MNRKLLSINKIIIIILIIFICVQLFYIIQLSLHRYFNFDEFQVLYAASALDRGKSLYDDNVGTHFPLTNLIFLILLKSHGYEVTYLLAARLLVFSILLFSLYLIYKIGTIAKDNLAGIFAVALTVSSIVFIKKGIEIRHDVFNMLFSLSGIYCIFNYIKEERISYYYIAPLFLGMAISSTQKAIIWIVGILVGFMLVLWHNEKTKFNRFFLTYPLLIALPLICSMSILSIFYDETWSALIDVAILKQIGYLFPAYDAQSVHTTHPFPYAKTEMWMILLRENGLFYLISLFSIVMLFFYKNGKFNEYKIIIAFWALSGIVFYLFMKRPFFQSFLPTIPPLALASALFLSSLFQDRIIKGNSKVLFAIIFIFLGILIYPLYITANMSKNVPMMTKQLDNVSYCLKYLEYSDKVLSFTQQQIFFDPIFNGMRANSCGNKISSMDSNCFEKTMIDEQCKIIIDDYRTRLLNKTIREKIAKHYRYSGIGDILIPGFFLAPKDAIEKEIWISGYYIHNAPQIIVDGKTFKTDILWFDQKKYEIKNITSEPVLFLYFFEQN